MSFIWPPSLPHNGDVLLRRARLPASFADDRLGLVDIAIVGGRIERIVPAGQLAIAASPPGVDLDGSTIWPGFVDLHTHLDKGHIWPRAENPDGSFPGALAAASADRMANWSADDVAARFEFALKCAYAHGTVAIRTHLDSGAPQHQISWPLFAQLRDAWRDRLDLQATSIVLIDLLQTAFGEELADLVAKTGGPLGAFVPMDDDIEAKLTRIFALAAARDLDLDFHADENGDPSSQVLLAIAKVARACRFAGRVTVGHCCSLAVQSDDLVDRTLDYVAAAGIAIVSLPMCNAYLQDRRPGRTPRWRGVTLLHEMRARGISVAVASDNCRDPFYAYGDLDMVEVFTQAVRIAQLDRPLEPWPQVVTSTPATIMGLTERGRIAPGLPADLIIFNARTDSEFLSRPQADRIVLRRGRPIDTRAPSYRELDHLFRPRETH